ncbi:MAG TPA: ribosome-associated translation inhibitor RaiA [Rhodanobacteraceae bacterium]|nr:ribosome-associated translation inhibitor RaiA [Rhodanobacteraceae bacterium]
MQLQISGQNVEVTQGLRDHVETKLRRTDRLFENVTKLTVVLSVEKLQHKADGTLAAAGRVLHADANEADMYASIDVMFEKLDSQLRKHKEKLTDHHQAEGRQQRYG